MKTLSSRESNPVTVKSRWAVAGVLSLITLALAIFLGIYSMAKIASETSEMASIGVLGGMGLGFLASIPSLIHAAIGLMRNEKPLWPAILGAMLSIIPAGLGLRILVELLMRH